MGKFEVSKEAEGKLRADFYHRLHVITLNMPPLREHKEDIPLLVSEFNARIMQEKGSTVRLTQAAVESMQAYSWPGNVRELRHVIERAAILSRTGSFPCSRCRACALGPPPAATSV